MVFISRAYGQNGLAHLGPEQSTGQYISVRQRKWMQHG